jgi:hypothetical protein
MNNNKTYVLDLILDTFPDEEFMIAEGFNSAVIGLDECSMRLIYSTGRCIDILVATGMQEDEAADFFDFNIAGSYVGERTPIWAFP